MAFEKLKFKKISNKYMLENSHAFYDSIIKRRTVRDFSDEEVPIEIIYNAIKSASSAPSGANKQPWHFVIVKDPIIKQDIRQAAEREEREFYDHRAPDDWLEDLNQFGTNWEKPFLETAPYLIVVFKKNYDLEGEKRKKNYYVNESVGIASGVLLTALHQSGLATLTHTPSPMGFLEKILNRPKNERAVLLIPVGLPSVDAMVPKLEKKGFEQICSIV
jgi:iodotyrosine deiodinase